MTTKLDDADWSQPTTRGLPQQYDGMKRIHLVTVSEMSQLLADTDFWNKAPSSDPFGFVLAQPPDSLPKDLVLQCAQRGLTDRISLLSVPLVHPDGRRELRKLFVWQHVGEQGTAIKPTRAPTKIESQSEVLMSVA
eukprot:8249462-Pyramimonas_sp.AAC.1